MSRPHLFLSLLSILTVAATAADLPLSADAVRPLSIGTQAPTPVLTAPDGHPFDLAAALAEKPTVLIFYRGGWCPFCNRHLAALAESELKLRELGFQIIGITPDAPEKLKPTAEENHVRYRLLSDTAMRGAGAYGVAYRLQPEAGTA